MRKLIQATPAIIYTGSAVAALISDKKIVMYFFIGTILFGFLMNNFLKNLVFKPILPSEIGERPKDSPETGCGNFDENHKSTSYGFPSGHSQIVGFTAMFWSLYMFKKDLQTIFRISILWILALLVVCSRVYYKCHTILQVITGFMFGIIFGYSYFRFLKTNTDIFRE